MLSHFQKNRTPFEVKLETALHKQENGFNICS